MKKKTVLAMLVMCMVFSASACSDKSAEKSAPEKTESSLKHEICCNSPHFYDWMLDRA